MEIGIALFGMFGLLATVVVFIGFAVDAYHSMFGE